MGNKSNPLALFNTNGKKPSKVKTKPKKPQANKNSTKKEKLNNSKTQVNNASTCVCPKPDWMSIVLTEMNKKIQRYSEQHRKGNHPTIMKYHDSTTLRNNVPKGTYGEVKSWCGTFVYWVLKKAGYNVTFPKGKYPFRAKDWAIWGKNHGEKFNKPIYGAIGVKTRHGGGHVSFVVGVDNIKKPKYVYMLGGNQFGLVRKAKNNTISWATEGVTEKGNKPYILSVLYPSRYRITAWDLGFYVPKKYYEDNIKNKKCCELEKYTGKFIISEHDGT